MAAASPGVKIGDLLEDLGKQAGLLNRAHAQQALVQQGERVVPVLLQAQTYAMITAEAARGVLSGILQDVSAEKRDAIRILLEQAVRKPTETAAEEPRRLAWYGLVTHFNAETCKDSTPGLRILQLAKDQHASQELRLNAIRSLKKMSLAPMDHEALLYFLDSGDEVFLEAVFDHLESHAENVSAHLVEKALLPLLKHASPQVRNRVIMLLGSFGDIDVLGTVLMVCVDAVGQPDLRKAIHALVDRLIERPRNLYKLTPEQFEHLVVHALTGLGFEDAKVTRFVKDGGVDGTARKRQRRPGASEDHYVEFVVQCKRYKDQVGPAAVLEFLEAIPKRLMGGAETRGLLVTTSGFSREARDEARKYPERIELIDGRTLVANLSACFGDGKYRV